MQSLTDAGEVPFVAHVPTTALRRGPPLLVLALLAQASPLVVGGCASFPDAAPFPENPRAEGRELLLDHGALPDAAGLRVYLLHVGDTLVTYDQFFSGHDGAVGFPGLWRMKTDERRFWAPVTCGLVVHPERGPVLIDTCVSRAQGLPGYYEGLAANVHSDDINRIPPGRDLVEQLAALGFAPADVKHIVVTHLHEDHVGSINDFPEATLHLARDEWENREHSPLFTPIYYEKNCANAKEVAPISFDDGRFGPFPAAEDLFGDGTVVVLPTIGHTPGHSSVLVNAGDHAVVFSGDAFYSLRHLHPPSLAAFGAYDEAWQALTHDAVERLVALRQHLPEVVLVAQHDPFVETRELFLEAFADGLLSPYERRALLTHERSFFDERGALLPSAQPLFLKGDNAVGPGGEDLGPVGTLTSVGEGERSPTAGSQP